MGDTLYDADILLWSERQAELLRRLARGERGLHAAVDWENVVEEVEAVGRMEFTAVVEALEAAMENLLLLRADPARGAAADLDTKARFALAEAARRVSPGMIARLDLAPSWRRAKGVALERLRAWVDAPCPHREVCPWTLDDLLAERPDLDALLARLD